MSKTKPYPVWFEEKLYFTRRKFQTKPSLSSRRNGPSDTKLTGGVLWEILLPVDYTRKNVNFQEPKFDSSSWPQDVVPEIMELDNLKHNPYDLVNGQWFWRHLLDLMVGIGSQPLAEWSIVFNGFNGWKATIGANGFRRDNHWIWWTHEGFDGSQPYWSNDPLVRSILVWFFRVSEGKHHQFVLWNLKRVFVFKMTLYF